jgi:hypothetical protein
MRKETIDLTLDEAEWLTKVAKRHGHATASGVLARLVDWANTEPPPAKKHLFLVIRCRRCSAGAKGGVKTAHDISLHSLQWQWLENVRERSKHASVGKTLRIIIDFYMPLCEADEAFEQRCLRAGANPSSERHKDAVQKVDPCRAPGMKNFFHIEQPKVSVDSNETSAGLSPASPAQGA